MPRGVYENREVVQKLVDGIAPSVGLDVMVIDDRLELVAGTGKARNEVGAYYGGGSLTERLLKTFKPYAADSPGKCEMCACCARKDFCSYHAVAIYPIMLGENAGGSLGLVASSREQKQVFYEKRNDLIKVASRLSFLIGAAFGESAASRQAQILNDRFQALLQVIEDGLIMTDSSGTIALMNSRAEKALGADSSCFIGRPLIEVFPDMPLKGIMNGSEVERKEAVFTFRKGLQFAGTIVPTIDNNGRFQGIALTFKKLSSPRCFDFGFSREPDPPEMIGRSPCFLEVKERALRVARTDSTVLIRGESGTGKEVLAKAIHAASKRRNAPFVVINCSAIPGELLESELFGYEEGAFTGAKKGGKPGKFEIANHGTMFLDEIGDMPAYLQAKVLRVIENKTFERVGGTSPIRVDVRIIAATNRDLEKAVENGSFREDLFYRLNVIPLRLPPLRERPEDIEPLVYHFIDKLNSKLGTCIRGIEEEALCALTSYSWPGNIRELENAIEYAMNLEEGEKISKNSLPRHIVGLQGDKGVTHDRLKALQDMAIRDALNRFGTSVAGKRKAAEYLGISLATLYRRMKAAKLERKFEDDGIIVPRVQRHERTG